MGPKTGFCTAKETTDQVKRQPTGWESIFTNDMTAKGLTSKVYKKLIQFNIKRSIKKISRRSE